jgi:hypothetical protein
LKEDLPKSPKTEALPRKGLNVKRLFSSSALAIAVFVAASHQEARAQNAPYSPYAQPNFGGYYSRPTVSPYLNIIRGNNPAINYFTGTIPERENRVRFNQVNTDIQNLERRAGTAAPTSTDELVPSLPETGHLVQFMNMNPYYSFGPGFNPGVQQVGTQASRRPAGGQPRR